MKINKDDIRIQNYYPKVEIAFHSDKLGTIELYGIVYLIEEKIVFAVSNKRDSQDYIKTFAHIDEAFDCFNELVKYL